MNVFDTRNLTFFRRHPSAECLHDDFAGDFGFRDAGSRFSILRQSDGAPGPDEVFTHVQTDARRLFEKLLGLELSFDPGEACGFLQSYSSANHYRSHIEEFFHWTAHQHKPCPPLRGECSMFFAACDHLVVRYRLRNPSDATIPVRISFHSRPCEGESGEARTNADGFSYQLSQQVKLPYLSRLRVVCNQETGSFEWKDGSFRTAPLEHVFQPGEQCEWTFHFCFSVDNETGELSDLVSEKSEDLLERAIERSNCIYHHLTELEGDDKCFKPLVLRAAGILQFNRYRDHDLDGREVMTIQAGKCGVAATWWWDGAIHLLGLGLCGDRETVRGAVHLLLGGVAEDGKPPVRYDYSGYYGGVQMPILAWGIAHANDANPDPELMCSAYEPLSRYVQWWWNRRGASGLVPLPNGCTPQDDSPRWSTIFPIAWEGGEPWTDRSWGKSHPADFECPDVNAHLYLELRVMQQMAEAAGLEEAAEGWAAKAEALAASINEFLFDPKSGMYQDRHIATGRLTGYLTSSSFIPIYAGLASKEVAVRACREYLLNPARFYTTLPFAGADQAHPAFCSGGRLYEVPSYPGSLLQSAYWIGRVWLQYSYWLTGALWQAGLHEEAEAARKKILEALSLQSSLYECYDPLTGQGNGHAEFSWGAAPALGLAYRQYRRGPVPVDIGAGQKSASISFADV